MSGRFSGCARNGSSFLRYLLHPEGIQMCLGEFDEMCFSPYLLSQVSQSWVVGAWECLPPVWTCIGLPLGMHFPIYFCCWGLPCQIAWTCGCCNLTESAMCCVPHCLFDISGCVFGSVPFVLGVSTVSALLCFLLLPVLLSFVPPKYCTSCSASWSGWNLGEMI